MVIRSVEQMVIYCGVTFPLFFFDEQMVIYCGGTFPLFSLTRFQYLFIYLFTRFCFTIEMPTDFLIFL